MRTPTADHCLTMAAEAERLASIVSYTSDKTRLLQQASDWRVQAQVLAVDPAPATAGAPSGRRLETAIARLRGRATRWLAKSGTRSASLLKLFHVSQSSA